MQITFQNSSKFAKSFTDQSSGQKPLYMGAASSIDLTPQEFLTYFDQFAKCTKILRPVDGMCRLLVVVNGTPGEVKAEDLAQGILDGHFGADAQALAGTWKTARDNKAAAEAEAELDRRAARRALG